MIRIAIVVVALAACHQNQTQFVRAVQVDGAELVVDRCWVKVSDENVDVGDCDTERHRLPMIVQPTPVIPTPVRLLDPAQSPQLDHALLDRGIDALREPLRACAASVHMDKPVRIHVAIDLFGKVSNVGADFLALTPCAAAAFDALVFPASRDGARFAFTFDPGAAAVESERP